MIQDGKLTTPLLYISGYLEMHRGEYYDRLQKVRESGDVDCWLQFFLTAVTHSAQDAIIRAGQLVELRESYLNEVKGSRSRIGELVDLILTNPFLTVARVQRALQLSPPGARRLIRDAQSRGWMEEVGVWGRGGRTYWVANPVFRIIEAPVSYIPEPDAAEDETPLTTVSESGPDSG